MKIIFFFFATFITLLIPFTSKADQYDDYIFFSDGSSVTIHNYIGSNTNVLIPTSITSLPVTAIEHFAFEGNTNLITITIPESITNIKSTALENCPALINIYVNITNMYYSSSDGVLFNKDKTTLFQYPTGKTGNYEIPHNVTNIDISAFAYCTNITSINIPNGVKVIHHSTFQSCSNLTTVNIGNNVTAIEDYAFYDSGLLSIIIPNSTTSIGRSAFSRTSITNLIIPDNVTTIESFAFRYCSSLTDVTIGDNVNYIGSSTFVGCNSLTNVTIGISLTHINSQTFGYTGLKNIVIPNNITHIGNSAFTGCTSLTNVVIGNSVTTIDYFAFYNTHITNIRIPSSVTNISYTAFLACSSLTNFSVDSESLCYSSEEGVLFNKDDTILISCPEGKTGNYIIQNTITNISIHAFYLCTQIPNIIIPDSVITIEESAFANCTSLTNIAIGNSVTSIGNSAFSACTNIGNIIIPESVITIEASAFAYCTSLTNITIGNSVTSIGDSALQNTDLTSITIPKSVTNIDNYAFSKCYKLNSVYFTGNPPPISYQRPFYQSYNVTVYYLPETSGWEQTFANRPTVLWNPIFTQITQDTGGTSCTITGSPNIPIRIETCTSLTSDIWILLQTNTLVNGSFQLSSSNTPHSSTRFYRITNP